jgi:hypothetical protein
VSGYRRARTVKLTWADDTEFAGLEIRAKRVSLATFLDFAPLIDGKFDVFDPEDRKKMRELFAQFGRVLVSWNLEDEDGMPVACTPEEYIGQDPAFVREVLDQWAAAITGVAAPLEQPSPGGEPFLEASLPMETLSPSLAN